MSCNTLSTKIRQLKIKIQTAGDGCEWDAPADADLIIGLEYGAVNNLETENVESNIAKSTLSKETSQAGVRSVSMDVSFRVMGAGVAGYLAGDKINVHPLIIGNGNTPIAVYKIPVSAISVGFVKGEIVTGAIGTETATVVKDTESTDTFILVKSASGAFQAENLTGSISGAAVATGAATLGGNEYLPISTGHQKLSVIAEEFGNMRTELYNCVFVGAITHDDSGLASYAGQIIGALRVVGGVEQYRRDYAVVALDQDITIQPALFKNARYKIGSFSPVLSGTTTFDTATAATQRRNANAESGLEGMFIGDRIPVHSVRFELVPNSDYDIYLDRLNVNTAIIQYYLGNTVGNVCYFHFPDATPTASSDEDQDNIAMVGATYALSGSNDDEYSWLTY